MARIVVALALILAGGLADARAATWTEARSPHFTVYSDAGERRARNVAWQLEQIRATLEKLWPWARLGLGRPVVVYAARDERSMRALVPGTFEGRNAVRPASLFLPAREAYYIALRLDIDTGGAPTVNPFMASYWSYLAMVLQASFESELPPWLLRGMAGVFSNTIVRDKEILIGPPIPWHLENLQQRARPTVADLLAANARSPLLAGDRMPMFESMAWAFVHYLMFGNQAKNLPLFNELADAVRRGADPAATATKLYGGPDALRNGIARYIDQRLFVYQKAQIAVGVDARTFHVRELSAADAALALARLHAAAGRPVEARAQLSAAAGAPAAAEVEGLLLEREEKKEEARAAYAKASAAEAAGFYGEYRLAMLSWPASGGEGPPDAFAGIEKSLRRSVELNPAFAPAHARLAGALASRDRPEEAKAAADRALALASTPEERSLAQQMIAFLAERAAAVARQADREAFADGCTAGDVAACSRLLVLVEESCRDGDDLACVSTAFLYSRGQGAPVDEPRAVRLLEPVCGRSVPAGCFLLGTLLVKRPDEADRTRGRQALETSCAGGARAACDLLKTLQ